MKVEYLTYNRNKRSEVWKQHMGISLVFYSQYLNQWKELIIEFIWVPNLWFMCILKIITTMVTLQKQSYNNAKCYKQ